MFWSYNSKLELLFLNHKNNIFLFFYFFIFYNILFLWQVPNKDIFAVIIFDMISKYIKFWNSKLLKIQLQLLPPFSC